MPLEDLVKPKPTPDIFPDKVNCESAGTRTVLLPPSVTVPDKLAVPPLATEIVPPFKVIASMPTLRPPPNCSLAPLSTMVPLKVLPNPPASLIAKIPPDTVVVPV